MSKKKKERYIYEVSRRALDQLAIQGEISEDILDKLEYMEDREFLTEKDFLDSLRSKIGQEKTERYQAQILRHVRIHPWARHWHHHKMKIIVPIAIAVVLSALFWKNTFISINSGHAGALWHRITGTNLRYVYLEGLSAILPIDKMYIYDMRVQEIHDNIKVLSSNGLVINVKFSARFQLQLQGLPLFHKTVGPDYVKKIIRPEVISTIRGVIGRYTPDELYATEEQKLLNQLLEGIRDRVPIEFLYMHSILIKELMLPTEIQLAIKDKLSEEQKYLAYSYILDRERSERERRRIEAEGVKIFQELTGTSILKWRGIDATLELAKSPNSKIIIMGTDSQALPVLFNADREIQTTAEPDSAQSNQLDQGGE
ncbi:MAG: hypothetical protein B6244_02790 [Candidatus Cloacimonetes bacterium 4572_55]|nr:MAG: hypothetical protein B6244_02790 [Candidatus Cloacimonetes bacterium 4572_55]